MLEFEISINDSKPLIVSSELLAFAKICYGNAELNLDSILVSGADEASRYTWLYQVASIGDKIRIKVVDVNKDEISSPQTIKNKDREQMTKQFYQLKQELQDKHLL